MTLIAVTVTAEKIPVNIFDEMRLIMLLVVYRTVGHLRYVFVTAAVHLFSVIAF